MNVISISKFKATCLAEIERVRKTGRPLLVTKHGVPVAQVLPPPKSEGGGRTSFGCMREMTLDVGDVVEPLPSDVWDAVS